MLQAPRPRSWGLSGPGAQLNIKLLFWCGFSAATLLAYGPAAYAQRSADNVVAQAEDAFGTRVGNENVGLYDARNARGFDPQQAGNIRIEGLYFDQQGQMGFRISKAQTMRIGLSAQSYPFPAPSGIADVSLMVPANKLTFSTQLAYMDYGMRQVAGDISTPLIGEKLGLQAGINRVEFANGWQGNGSNTTTAALLNFRPADNVEFIPLIFHNHMPGNDVQPSILPGGEFLPPQFDRNVFTGQDWATSTTSNLNVGIIGRASFGSNWRLQGDFFRSIQDKPNNHTVFFRNTQADGSANLDIVSYPHHKAASFSGEVRGSGIFTDGSYRHTVHVAVRARDVNRIFGGGQTISFGATNIAVVKPVPEPTYTFGIRDQDLVRQISPGITYVGQWARVGEFSVGLQKSFYRRNFGKIGAVPITTKSAPWLYNGTLSVIASPSLTFYAGYTRGLEEFGTAPDTAVNAGEPLPAKQTKQVDGGLRWRIQPGLNLMAGVFQVEKPYFDRDTANIYTNVGALRHRGVEMSLSGQPVKGLTVVAGVLYLQAKASGLSVDRGLIGDTSPGTPPLTIKTNLQYDLPFASGVVVDSSFDVIKGSYANRTNTFKTNTQAVLSLGVRYAFKPFGYSSSLRFQVMNVTDQYAWTADNASGRLAPIQGRRYSVRLATDFSDF